MKIERHESSKSPVPVLTLVVKISLCLWIAGVMFVFLVRYLPPEYLFISDQLDIHTWVLRLREWLNPFFHELKSDFPLPRSKTVKDFICLRSLLF